MKSWRTVSGNFGKKYLANDETSKIIEKGDVRIQTPNGHVRLPKSVKHIPLLKRNLTSLGQLDDERYTTSSMNDLWRITKGAIL